jgi:hypothetical protein
MITEVLGVVNIAVEILDAKIDNESDPR